MSIVGLTLSSCSLDDNINPDKVLADNVTPNLRLSAASVSSYSVQAGSMNFLGNAWMNSWSGNFATYGNPFTTESNLDITTAYQQGIFQNLFRAVSRFQQVISDPKAANYPNYVAIAKIQKAYYMQYLVDLYGDIPYSEAFMEASNTTPKYDKDVVVYSGLVDELIQAKALVSSVPADAVEVSADPIFQGNMSNWTRFANTVLLKYAVRLSNTSNADGQALKNKIIANLSGASYITADVKINPGYNASASTTQNPLYGNFGYRTFDNKLNTQGYRLQTASMHMVESLLGKPGKVTQGVSDPRIEFLFTKCNIPSGAGGGVGYYGFVQGQTKTELEIALGMPPSSLTIGNFSFLGGIFAKATPDTGAAGSATDGFVMTLAEAYFLQAEAAALGYAGFTNAQGSFENGVKASFAFDGKSADAAAYITAITGKAKVGWTGVQADDLSAIQYQRWVALTNYNGIESFINYLRTGSPYTPLATTAIKPNKPYRLLYPSLEYSTNSANVPDVSQAAAFDKNAASTPFIYK